MWGQIQKTAVCKQERESLPGTKLANTLIFNFTVFRTVRNVFLLFRLQSLLCFVIAPLADLYTYLYGTLKKGITELLLPALDHHSPIGYNRKSQFGDCSRLLNNIGLNCLGPLILSFFFNKYVLHDPWLVESTVTKPQIGWACSYTWIFHFEEGQCP